MAWFNDLWAWLNVFTRLTNLERQMSSITNAITAFKTQVDAAFASITDSLNNIAADEATLSQQIQDLKAQLEAGGNLSTEDQAALDAVAQSASDLAAKTKQIADTIPEAPPAPTTE